MKILLGALVAIMGLTLGQASYAHSGRTDSSGGHHDRKNGGYHYHNGGSSSSGSSSGSASSYTQSQNTATPPQPETSVSSTFTSSYTKVTCESTGDGQEGGFTIVRRQGEDFELRYSAKEVDVFGDERFVTITFDCDEDTLEELCEVFSQLCAEIDQGW